MEATLPALAGGNAAGRIEIEEEIVPAFRRQPVAESNRLGIVMAGMADKDAGHDAPRPN